MPRHRKKFIDLGSAIVLFALLVLDALLWRTIWGDYMNGTASAKTTHGSATSAAAPRVYPLSVPHGTSTLMIFPNNVTVLTDAGPDATIVDKLQKALPSGAPAYIDLAIISIPQNNNYTGYEYLLQHYGIGAFLYNGRADTAHKTEWTQLMSAIAAKHIPLITIGAGDRVRVDGIKSFAGSEIDILAPDAAHAHSPNASDTVILQRVVR
jgi:beta-lactamase superfamily II metal-dependent hydrolase